MTEPSPLEPSIALSAYTEPLASNRRVLVFGNGLSALPLQLLERGARSVHVSDPDARRAAEASTQNRSSQISFSSLEDSDLALRDTAFDLALIDNLTAFDAVSVLRTAKRALATRGVLVVACPNPEAAFPLIRVNDPQAASLDYYALYDAVAAEFEYVRMLGQTPFVGYAIADFSASGEPEPVLDTSFVPGGAEEPDSFIALASAHEVRLEEFAVIQLPTRRLFGGPGARVPAAERNDAELQVHEAQVARLNQWIAELESRASTADERADHTEAEIEGLRPALEAERQMRVTLSGRHEQERSALQTELDELRAELGSLREKSSALGAESNTLREDSSAKAAELKRLTTELSRISAELSQRDQHLAGLSAKLEVESQREVSEFERKLVERGGEIRRLEQDLRTAERTGRELVRELERRRSESSASAGAELERALAEREADLQAAAWTIESLSLRLEMAGEPAGQSAAAPETAISNEDPR